MRVLAIDPGTQCGWAISQVSRAAIGTSVIDKWVIDVGGSGVWDLSPRRGESSGFRFLRLRGQLNTIRDAYPDLQAVVYEQAHHRGGAPTEVGVGISTHVQSWCAENEIECASVHSATLKKHATGRGNANKELMLSAAKSKFSINITDHNQADALWLLHWALENLG